jgi:hypothetical protein
VRAAQRGLQIMADASGGFGVTNTDDQVEGVREILDDLNHYYVLGFRPAHPAKGYRPLKVLVDLPDASVRYRRGYQLPDAAADKASATDPMQALVRGVLSSGDLSVRLFATALPGDGQTARVPAVLEVALPRAELQDAAGVVRTDLTYQMLAADERDGKVADRAEQQTTVTLRPKAGSRAATAALIPCEVTTTLNLKPGAYQLRAAVMSTTLARGGSVYFTLDVPDFTKGLALSHVIVGRAAERNTGAAAGTPGWPFRPILDRTFRATDVLRVYAAWRGAGPAAASVALLDASHAVVRTAARVSLAAGTPLDVDVPLTGLTPGTYVLQVSLSGGAGAAQRELELEVR